MWVSDLGVRHAPPPHPTHLPEPSSSPRAAGTMLGGSAGSYWTGKAVAAHWDGFRGGSSCGRQTLGSAVPPPAPQAPTCLTPSSSPRARGAVLGGSAGSFRTGEAFAGGFGDGGGACSCGRQGKGGVCERSGTQVSLEPLSAFFLAKIPVINTGVPLSQVSLEPLSAFFLAKIPVINTCFPLFPPSSLLSFPLCMGTLWMGLIRGRGCIDRRGGTNCDGRIYAMG